MVQLLVVMLVITCPGAKAQQVRKPNVIFILADDLGYGDLGCYGQQHIQTPHLDQMARDGIRFTQFYAGSTVCAPSRCALMTGKHIGNAYIRGNGYPGEGDIPLRSAEITLAEALKSAGYRTGMFGKWGLGAKGTEGAPDVQGWDEYFGVPGQVDAHFQQPEVLWEIENGALREVPQPKGAYANESFTENALSFVRENQERPFFMYLSLTIPHAELHVPPVYLKPYLQPNGQSRFAPEKAWADGQHYGGQPFPKAAYAALVSSVDAYVGRVLATLKELQLEENTLVIFASDNGTHVEGGRTAQDVSFFNSSGGLRGVKRDLYEGGIRTPFLVQWKGTVPAGAVSGHPGAFWDVLPTLAELAGIQSPPTDGISFLPTLKGDKPAQQAHEYLYWEFYERGFSQALRAGDWKAVKLGKNGGRIELYHLGDDPAEEHDVAGKHPELVTKLDGLLKKAHSKSDIFPLVKK